MGRLTLVSLVGAAHRKEILETGPRGSRRPAVLSLLESNGEAGNDTGERVTYPHSEIRLVYAALFSRPRIGVAGWIKVTSPTRRTCTNVAKRFSSHLEPLPAGGRKGDQPKTVGPAFLAWPPERSASELHDAFGSAVSGGRVRIVGTLDADRRGCDASRDPRDRCREHRRT